MERNIPIDLCVEICRYLPIKTLLTFRIVCKAWKSFIDSKNFNLIRMKPFLNFQPFLFLVEDLFDSYLWDSNKLFVDYCYGLILYKHLFDDNLILWNPLIKKHMTLLLCPLTDLGQSFYHDTCIVLGFLESIGDYKVIVAQFPFEGTMFHVAVFTLDANSWTVSSVSKHGGFNSMGYTSLGKGKGTIVCADAAFWFGFHHMAGVITWGPDMELFSFDFNHEVFSCYPLPNELLSASPGLVRFLFPLNNSVGIYFLDSTSHSIWVLDQTSGQWIKWFCGKPHARSSSELESCSYPISRVMFVPSDLMFWIETVEELILYSINTHCIRRRSRDDTILRDALIETLTLCKGMGNEA